MFLEILRKESDEIRDKHLLILLGRRGSKGAQDVDASKKHFSWFPDWIQKVQGNVNLVDLGKGFPKILIPTLRTLASIQPRMSPLKFAKR